MLASLLALIGVSIQIARKAVSNGGCSHISQILYEF